MHPALEQIRQATIGTPFEGQLWLVGGAVRDELLGIPHEADFDIVLVGSSEELAKFLYKKKISKIRPVTYERFGTAMIHVLDSQIELVTARRESYESGSRKPQVEPATLEEDALRRDFTVNTLLRNLHTGELKDPLGCGVDDLKKKLLKTPLDPVETFHDDPLRMLRAVRFRWKLGFEPAKGLYGAIKREAHRLKIISGERIRDELTKMLMHPTCADAMAELMDLGLLSQFAPEFEAMVGLEQGDYHHLDGWEHSLEVLRGVAKQPGATLELRLAALLHDIAKPETKSIDEKGRVHFFGHDQLGADMADRMLRRLKFSLDEIDRVKVLIRNHMRLTGMSKISMPAARRLVRDLGNDVPVLLDLVQADRAAHKDGIKHPGLDQIRETLEQVQLQTPQQVLESPLQGGEIMELLGLPPGPQVGKWKAFLTEQVLDGFIQPADKEAAKAALLRAVAESSAP